MTAEELFEEIEKAKAANPELMKAIELCDQATKVYQEALKALGPQYKITVSNRTTKPIKIIYW
jgi:hypothetical protein